MFELIYPIFPAPEVPSLHADSPHGECREMFPLVDPNGTVTGQASRRYCHSGAKVLHPVIHLHIIDRNGRLYLQKRSMKKDIQPGKWDTATGGHVSYGESLVETLFRETAEELGRFDFNPIYIDSYIFESEIEKELVNIFAAVGTFDLKPDGDELEDGRFWEMDEIEENLGKSLFTPNFEGEFIRIKQRLLSLL